MAIGCDSSPDNHNHPSHSLPSAHASRLWLYLPIIKLFVAAVVRIEALLGALVSAA
jgi:hypothetical protein